MIARFMEWLGNNPELQRAFAVFVNRMYLDKKADPDKIYQDAKFQTEDGAMLQENVKRWIEEWRAEGEARGRAEGDKEARIRFAQKLLAGGMSISQTIRFTELSEQDIKNLIDN